MIHLPKTLEALQFGQMVKSVLRDELRDVPDQQLPLQSQVRYGSVALKDDLEPVILSSRETGDGFELTCEIFYHSINAGCHCAGDPGPRERLTESLQLRIEIRSADAEARLAVMEM